MATSSDPSQGVDSALKRYGAAAFIMAIAIAVVLLLCGQPAVARGIVLGTIAGIVNFILMGYMLHWRLASNHRKATLLAFGGIALRYTLLALPIVAALKWQKFNLVAVVVGIFMVQLTLLIDQCCPALISSITLNVGGMQKHGKSG